jgi:hypothetical protein
VADLKDGIYAVGFGGGQVDITNGKFVFSCTEAYRVKNGKVGAPVKGATLIGDGATALQQIRASATTWRWTPAWAIAARRPMGAGGRGPADAADRRADRWAARLTHGQDLRGFIRVAQGDTPRRPLLSEVRYRPLPLR